MVNINLSKKQLKVILRSLGYLKDGEYLKKKQYHPREEDAYETESTKLRTAVKIRKILGWKKE